MEELYDKETIRQLLLLTKTWETNTTQEIITRKQRVKWQIPIRSLYPDLRSGV